MKLADFMAREEISTAAFAHSIGVGSISVTRYLTGARLPAADVLVKIAEVTDGAVTPNDFLLPARKAGPREAAE
jgi:DNA-binding transcriptional regulator YdaS (Cro superfamily)